MQTKSSNIEYNFLDYFLEDRKIYLAFSEQFQKTKDIYNNIDTLNNKVLQLHNNVNYSFETYGSYLNQLARAEWIKTKNILDSVLHNYIRNYELSLFNDEPVERPSDKIKSDIGSAKKVLSNLNLNTYMQYSDNGKTFISDDGSVRDVAPSAVNRVLLHQLLNKYIDDLENKTFNIAHHGAYYPRYKISKQPIKDVLKSIRKNNNLLKSYLSEKELIDSIKLP
jgi:predicted heme/steroid binding protein